MGPSRPVTVLIVDDNPTIRTMLRMMIHGDEYNVVGEAGDGALGLERALKFCPDIVCLDVQMPGKGGLDVLMKIKEELPRTAVLMVTASNDRTTVDAAIARGASGFILKPFNAATVLATLKKAVALLRPPSSSSRLT